MPTYGRYIDQEFKLHLAPKTTSRFFFNNYLIETASGAEQRIPARLEYLAEITFDTITHARNCDEDTLDEFREFYIETAQGRLNSFKYKNPLDYYASREILSHGEFSKSYSLTIPLDETYETYQVLKVYQYGEVRGYKTLAHLDSDNLSVYVNDALTVQYTINRGTIIFNPPLTETDVVEVDTEFLLQVRFSENRVKQVVSSVSKVDITGLGLTEIADTSLGEWVTRDFEEATDSFDFGFKPTYTDDIILEDFLDIFASGRETRQQRYNERKDEINIDGNKLVQEEKDNLLCLFIAMKGRLLDFPYERNTVRFNSDELLLNTILQGN